MRRYVVAALALAGALAVADAAHACGQLRSEVAARLREGYQAQLDGAHRVIRGRWIPDATGSAGGTILPGRIEYRLWGKTMTLRATSTSEFMPCSYFMYPTGESKGLFYLERTGPDAYRIIHFE